MRHLWKQPRALADVKATAAAATPAIDIVTEASRDIPATGLMDDVDRNDWFARSTLTSQHAVAHQRGDQRGNADR